MVGSIVGLAARADAAAGPTVTVVPVAVDPTTATAAQHNTLVEVAAAAHGNTIVAVSQAGRFNSGGSAAGALWATSTNGGVSWTSGLLPRVTLDSNPAGSYPRVVDENVAYDEAHDTWLIAHIPVDLVNNNWDEILAQVSRSTDGGQTWGTPVPVITSGQPDKQWTTCDNGATSPRRGTCYLVVTLDLVNNGELVVSRSTDGGLTWSSPIDMGTTGYNVQPLVQPDGTVVVVDTDSTHTQVQALRSTDGGSTWSAPVTVSPMANRKPTGLRALFKPTAAVDRNGALYVMWDDCAFRTGCSSNDLVFSTSSDGMSWTAMTRVNTDALNSGIDHVIPALGLDTSVSPPRLGVQYNQIPVAACGGTSQPACLLQRMYIESPDGGTTWGSPVPLEPAAVPFTSFPSAGFGRMPGDYQNLVFSGGRAVAVVPFAGAPGGGLFHLDLQAATISNPPPASAVVTDTFTRTVANGWGTSDSGAIWTVVGNPSGVFAVNGSTATITTNTGATRVADLASVSVHDVDVQVQVATNVAPGSGNGERTGIHLRRTANNSEYRTRLRYSSNGAWAGVVKLTGTASETLLGPEVPLGLAYSPNAIVNIRAQATGANPTTIRVRHWAAGAPEPAGWDLTVSDSQSGLQGSGGVGLQVLPTSGTTGPVTWTFDNLQVTDLATPPPPNNPPVASATVSCSAMQCNIDGASSTDSDGTVVSWAWDFGDGSSSTGTTTSHTYAVAGDWPVTLRVTDDKGATATTTITATPLPPANPSFAADAFSRVTSAGWGVADQGGAWAPVSNTSDFSTGGSTATVVLPGAGAKRVVNLGSVNARDVDAAVTFSFDKAETGTGQAVSLIARRVNDTTQYRARARAQGGYLYLSATRLAGGSSLEANVAPEQRVAGIALTPGLPIRLRAQFVGVNPTTITIKAWAASTTEPASWTTTVTDSTASLQTGGSIGVAAQLWGNATNAPVLASVDDLQVQPPNTAPTGSFTQSCSNLSCTYNATASDLEGPVSLTWNFGDGSTATGSSPVHAFPSPGTRVVTLTVTDSAGWTKVVRNPVTV